MRYKLAITFDGCIDMVDDFDRSLLTIYFPTIRGKRYKTIDEEGFWEQPDDFATRSPEANKDYNEHREEYKAEARKLYIKEML